MELSLQIHHRLPVASCGFFAFDRTLLFTVSVQFSNPPNKTIIFIVILNKLSHQFSDGSRNLYVFDDCREFRKKLKWEQIQHA